LGRSKEVKIGLNKGLSGTGEEGTGEEEPPWEGPGTGEEGPSWEGPGTGEEEGGANSQLIMTDFLKK